MKRARVLLTVFILIFSVSIGSAALAGPGKWDEHAVPVPLERNNGVYCTLDTATIRSAACLNDTTFVDVWVKYKLDENAWQRLEMIHDGELSGDELTNVRIIKVRYLFRLENAASGKVPLKFELERRYEGADGQLIHSDGFRVPDAKSKWYTLDTTEQKVLLRLLTEPNFYHSAPMDTGLNEYMLPCSCKGGGACRTFSGEKTGERCFIGDGADKEGFLGIPWGTRLKDCKTINITGSVNLGEYQVVYTYDGMGDFKDIVDLRTPVLLFFAGEQGLVMLNWQYEAMRPSLVESALRNSMGEPINRGGNLTWKVNNNTRYELGGYRNGYIEGLTVMSEAFWQKEKTLFRYL